jgi:hypothetical protein
MCAFKVLSDESLLAAFLAASRKLEGLKQSFATLSQFSLGHRLKLGECVSGKYMISKVWNHSSHSP